MLTQIKIALLSLVFLVLVAFPVYAQKSKLQLSRKIYEKGLSFDTRGEYDLAELNYKKVLHIRGSYADAEYRLCYLLAGQLRFTESLKYIRLYYAHDNNLNVAESLNALKEMEKAASLQILLTTQNKPELNSILEFTELVRQYSRERWQGALDYSERALNLYPNSVDAMLSHINILRHLYPRKRDQEFSYISKVLSIEPNNPKGHYLLGKFWEIDDRQMAIQEFKKALELSSGKLILTWYDLGRTYMFSGQNKEAIESFKMYLKLAVVPVPIREEIERNIKLLS